MPTTTAIPSFGEPLPFSPPTTDTRPTPPAAAQASQTTPKHANGIHDAKHYSPAAVAGISIGTLILGALLAALLTVRVLRRKYRRQKERDVDKGVWVAELARDGKDEREREREMKSGKDGGRELRDVERGGVVGGVVRDTEGGLQREGR